MFSESLATSGRQSGSVSGLVRWNLHSDRALSDEDLIWDIGGSQKHDHKSVQASSRTSQALSKGDQRIANEAMTSNRRTRPIRFRADS